MDAVGPDSKVCRNPKITYRDLEDGGVVLNLQSGAYHGLNRTGAAIWRLLEAEPTLDELVEQLGAQLDDSPSTLRDEVGRFLQEMRQRGLVTLRRV